MIQKRKVQKTKIVNLDIKTFFKTSTFFYKSYYSHTKKKPLTSNNHKMSNLQGGNA